MRGIDPVSYTHLDVYKRQHTCIKFNNALDNANNFLCLNKICTYNKNMLYTYQTSVC